MKGFVLISHSSLSIFFRYRMDRDLLVVMFSSFLHIHMTILFVSYSKTNGFEDINVFIL